MQHGASVNAVDNKNSNALHYAAYNAHAESEPATPALDAFRRSRASEDG